MRTTDWWIARWWEEVCVDELSDLKREAEERREVCRE
jgi:hypothetical protein